MVRQYRAVPQPAKGLLALARITQSDLARRHGVTPQHVNRVVNGWQAPSPRLAKAIADDLGVSVEEAFRDDLTVVPVGVAR